MTTASRAATGPRVCMVSYGEANATLPPMFHGATSLGAAGFDVETLCNVTNFSSTTRETLAPGYRTRRFPLRTRALFHSIFPRGAPGPIGAIQNVLTFAEYVTKAFVLAWRAAPDLYEAHDLPALLPTWLAARLRRRPLVYRANEMFSETHARVRFASLWRRLERRLVPGCDEVVTPDEFRSRIYLDELGARHLPLTVRNCPPYRPPVESTKLRDELRRRGVDFQTIVLYQGLVDSMRCIEEIAEASRSFDPGVVLVVIGSGFGAWASPAERLAGHDRIVTIPRVPYEELAPYTASADMGILLYRNDCRNNYYCAPNKIFEYMMMGLPMIAPSFPGMRRLVEDGDVGASVDPADPREIAAAVNRLHRDPAARARMKANGLRLSRERYHWQHEFAPLLERYRALLSPSATPVAAGGDPGAAPGSPARGA